MTQGLEVTAQYRQAICRVVRLFKDGDLDEVVGAGFLVSDRHILTCAHVVNAALSERKESLTQPAQSTWVEFLGSQPDKFLPCKVVYWLPMGNTERKEDIAVLELHESASFAPVLLLRDGNPQPDTVCEAYGFPQRGMQSGGLSVCRLQSYGLYPEESWGQLENIEGYPISKGFSGTLLWDRTEQRVAGMVLAAEYRNKDPQRGFMLPVSVLAPVVDLVRLFCCLGEHETVVVRQLQAAYRFCLPELLADKSMPAGLENLQIQLEKLEATYRGSIGKFVAHLIESLQLLAPELSLALMRWVREFYDEVRAENFCDQARQSLDQQQQVEVEGEESQSAVLVVVEHGTNCLFRVKVFGVLDCEQCEFENYHDSLYESDLLDKEYRWEEIPQLLARCLEIAERKLLNPRIEVFLPFQKLKESIAFWEIPDKDDEDDFDYLGIQYSVVHRSYDRLLKKSKYLQWQKRWQGVKAAQESAASQSFFRCSGEREEIFKSELPKDDYLGLCLTRAPRGKKAFNSLFKNGVPLALWIQKDLDHLDCEQAFDDLLAANLEDLAERVRNQWRIAYRSGIDHQVPLEQTQLGQHLSLLWDNPSLLPPLPPLSMP